MYRITYGDNVIFDPYDEELKVPDASMSDEINAAAYLDFTISVLHPLYDTRTRQGRMLVFQREHLVSRDCVLDRKRYTG